MKKENGSSKEWRTREHDNDEGQQPHAVVLVVASMVGAVGVAFDGGMFKVKQKVATTRFDSSSMKREETKATALRSGGQKATTQAVTKAAATSICRSRSKLTAVVASSTALCPNISSVTSKVPRRGSKRRLAQPSMEVPLVQANLSLCRAAVVV